MDLRGGTFKNPMRLSSSGVDFVPPSQTDEAAAGDVFQVVEVDGEEEEGQDEDEDEVGDEEDAEEVH